MANSYSKDDFYKILCAGNKTMPIWDMSTCTPVYDKYSCKDYTNSYSGYYNMYEEYAGVSETQRYLRTKYPHNIEVSRVPTLWLEKIISNHNLQRGADYDFLKKDNGDILEICLVDSNLHKNIVTELTLQIDTRTNFNVLKNLDSLSFDALIMQRKYKLTHCLKIVCSGPVWDDLLNTIIDFYLSHDYEIINKEMFLKTLVTYNSEHITLYVKNLGDATSLQLLISDYVTFID